MNKNAPDIASTVLSLSRDIAFETNNTVLFDKIFEDASKLLGVTKMKIDLIGDDIQTHYILFNSDEKESFKDSSIKYPLANSLFEVVLNSKLHVSFDMRELEGSKYAYDYLRSWKQAGIRKFLGIPLQIEGVPRACLWMCVPPKYDESLLDYLVSQVLIAVSRVVINDERQKQENEKSLLLDFSVAIAAVKDKPGLASVIDRYLKDLGLIKNYGISINDKDVFFHFMNEESHPQFENESIQKMTRETFPIKKSFAEVVFRENRPVTYYMEELIGNEEVQFPYAAVWLSVGVNPITGVPLKIGDENIGVLWIQPNRINDSLLSSMAAHISIAVSNIIAIEKIKEREEEKSTLLSFSNSLAKVRNRQELSELLADNLRRYFLFTDFVITIKSGDAVTYFAFDKKSQFDKSVFEQTLKVSEDESEQPICQLMMGSDVPVFIKLNQFKQKENLIPNVSLWLSINQDFISGTNLKVSDKEVGVLWTVPGQASDELLIGVCSQIAIALSNVAANEKVHAQLDEINTYKQQLELENLYLQKEIHRAGVNHEIIGDSAPMQKIFRLVSQVAFTNSTVLLTGETGTGKELIAKAIHNSSSRKDKLMVKVNCATLPASLIESELFGHEKGSFTGAHERRIGKFELANNGTLFLDEIGEMPLELQVKLLRALQEKEIERLGGKNVINVDVRVVAATNRDLIKEVEAGRFRRDLYYRLNVFPISLPALRDRKEDIPALASHFLQKHSRNIGKRVSNISSKAISSLNNYTWPGNVRELEHLIERSILMCEGSVLDDIIIPDQEENRIGNMQEMVTLEENERNYILLVLEYCKWKVSGTKGAAAILGIPVSTLNSRMKKLSIERTMSASLK